MKLSRIILVLLLVVLPVLASLPAPAYGAPSPAQVVMIIQPNGDESSDLQITNSLPTQTVPNNTTIPFGAQTLGGITTLFRALIYFDLSNIPANASIIEASLILTLSNNNPTASTAQVFALDECFLESQASWNTRQAGTNWITPGGTYSDLIATKSFPVMPIYSQLQISLNTNSIQHLVTGYKQNCGWLIRTENETLPSTVARFFSGETFDFPQYRPKLVITYNIPDPTATPIPSPTLPLYPTLNAEEITLSSGNTFHVERRATFGETGLMLVILCIALPFSVITLTTYLTRRR